MKEMRTFRGHDKEVTALAWHPQQEDAFVTGGYDGSILFWNSFAEEPTARMTNAHDSSVWSLDWHPAGHILCSGSNDHTTKFWCRNRPGDLMTDKYNQVVSEDDLIRQTLESLGPAQPTSIPGLSVPVLTPPPSRPKGPPPKGPPPKGPPPTKQPPPARPPMPQRDRDHRDFSRDQHPAPPQNSGMMRRGPPTAPPPGPPPFPGGPAGAGFPTGPGGYPPQQFTPPGGFPPQNPYPGQHPQFPPPAGQYPPHQYPPQSFPAQQYPQQYPEQHQRPSYDDSERAKRTRY